MPGYSIYWSDEEDNEEDAEEKTEEMEEVKKVIKIKGTRASRRHSRTRRSQGVAMSSSSTKSVSCHRPQACAQPDAETGKRHAEIVMTLLNFTESDYERNKRREIERLRFKKRDSKRHPLKALQIDTDPKGKGERMNFVNVQVRGLRQKCFENREGRSRSDSPVEIESKDVVLKVQEKKKITANIIF